MTNKTIIVSLPSNLVSFLKNRKLTEGLPISKQIELSLRHVLKQSDLNGKTD